MRYLKPVFPLLMTSALSAPVLAAGAHVHGRADLEIAVEAGRLEIRLAGPLDGFVGFEHRPRDDAQRAALAAALAALEAPGRLVEPVAEAGCRLTAADVAEPFHHDDHHDDHADPDGHAELEAEWRFTCASPDALSAITVRLGERFPRLERLEAVFVGPAGQGATTLPGGHGRVELR
ncbi:MAG: DUF2796 domain-containing protein [Rhodocyclaceae bacterium]|nr:DUF2796 domain-containing protein [Rhodocyclaceae bacterium]